MMLPVMMVEVMWGGESCRTAHMESKWMDLFLMGDGKCPQIGSVDGKRDSKKSELLQLASLME